MSELKNLQSAFQEYLLHPEQQSILMHIAHSGQVSADARLAVYRDAYRSRLAGSLIVNFPFLYRYMGEDAFKSMALDYIESHPSFFRSIRWYGNELPAFLSDSELYRAQDYLFDMARLDWMMTLVFDAPDANCIDVEWVQMIPREAWPEMKITFHPSVHRVDFRWNVVESWQAAMTDEALLPLVKYENPIRWLFWRRELVNQFRSLADDEAWFIDQAKKGESFAEMCEGLCQWHAEGAAGMRAASILKGLIVSGAVSDVRRQHHVL